METPSKTTPRRLFTNTVALANIAAALKQQRPSEFLDDLVRQYFRENHPDKIDLLEEFAPQNKPSNP